MYTEQQIENIADHLRSAGFAFGDEWDNDKFALIADCILGALHIELPEYDIASLNHPTKPL